MLRRLAWLAVGTFAIGTEGFMIAGLLPTIAADLDVTVSSAGQLVTVFALVYALGGPVLATITADWERRRLLLWSMAGFLAANLLAAASTHFAGLVGARVLLALTAGTFSPAALAFAGTSVEPHHRGRALSIVVGGVSAAVALGAPLGTWVGNALGWRATFLVVAGLSALAFVGVALFLPRQQPQAGISLRQRLRIAATPGIGRTLLVTLLWSMGGFTIYTYSASLFRTVAGVEGSQFAFVLLTFGIGAVFGTFSGGQIVDRFGSGRLIATALFLLATIGLAIPIVAGTLTSSAASIALFALFGGWGVVGWAFFPAQQSRLVGIAPSIAPIALSLNQSSMYLGMAGGALLGALTMRLGAVANVGWVGAVCELSALTVMLFGRRSTLPIAQPVSVAKAS